MFKAFGIEILCVLIVLFAAGITIGIAQMTHFINFAEAMGLCVSSFILCVGGLVWYIYNC